MGKKSDGIKRVYFDPALLIIVVVLLYFPTAFYGLTYFDDNVWLIDKAAMFGSPQAVMNIFRQPDIISDLFYRPVIALSFWVNSLFKTPAVAVCHVFNIVLHAINVCLVFGVFLLLGYRREESRELALLFAVHPVLVSAVAWIPGRTESLLAISVLVSIISFIFFFKRGNYIWLIVHAFFCALALLAKETAVAIPLICLGFIFLLNKDIAWKKIILSGFVWFAIGFVWLMVRFNVLSSSRQLNPESILTSVGDNFSAFITYIGKIFLPVNLSVLPVPQDLPVVYGLVSIVFLSLLIFFSKNKRWKFIVFGASWFALFIFPALVVSFINHEYRLYLPLIGILIVVAETDIFKQHFTDRSGKTAFIVLLVLLAGTAFRYSGQFRNKNVFWQNAVKNSPSSPLAHRNRGAMLYLDGDMEGAAGEYKAALQLNENEQMVHNNLGLIFLRQGNYSEAERYFRKEININPNFANAYYNLGLVYWAQKKTHDAAFMWKKTILYDPYNYDAVEKLKIYESIYRINNI